ncbi:hypothetical protein CPG38_03840 [Malaciobacter marinus]|uniref:hypothetical protein n=1 Tax=Malaciobacter marinus TaxID=505249 RepID=UPI000C07F7C6|nr:hypothetical protein [Malaciobacter marinus]PHO13338.1 hypothetical protein CPG38_03840 [Malaciobacter marinus]
MNENKRRRSPIKFPVSLDEVEKLIQENHINYKIDYSQHLKKERIYDKTQPIFLFCNKHKTSKINTSWEKINSREGRRVEYCNICKCDKQGGSFYLRYKVEEIFENHPTHPKTLIDNRFTKYDRILAKTKLKTKCILCKYEDYVSIQRFNSKDHGCRGCRKLKIEKGQYDFHKIEEINKIFIPHGYKISNVRNNNNEKLLSYKCNKCEFTQIVSRGYILRRKSKFEKDGKVINLCKKCNEFSNYNSIKDEALKRNFILVDKFIDLFNPNGIKQYINTEKKFNFLCKNNPEHKRNCRVATLHENGICKECEKDKRGVKNFKELVNKVEEFGGVIIEKERSILYKEEVYCKCSYGHKFTTSLTKIGKLNFCPECSDKIGEKMTRIILTNIFCTNQFIKQKPSFLQLSNNSYLEYDAYCEELKIAAEYNGLQHYEYRKHYHKTNEEFLRQKENDKLKLKLSKENNIKVIAIKEEKNRGPNKENIIKQIEKECKKLNIILPNPNFDRNIDVRAAYLGDKTKFNTLTHIDEYKGSIIKEEGNEYKSKRSKLNLKCADPFHESFELDPRQLLDIKKWCPECELTQNIFEKFYDLFDGVKDEVYYVGYKKTNNSHGIDKIYLILKCSCGHESSQQIRTIKRTLDLNKHWCPSCKKIAEMEENKKKKWDNALRKVKKGNEDISIDYELSSYEDGVIVFYNNLGIQNQFNLYSSKYLLDKPKKNRNSKTNQIVYISEEKKSEYTKLIKSIYGVNASYISNVGNGLREWHCGRIGHPTFKQTSTRLKQEKKNRGCKICEPSNSTKLTLSILLYVANKISQFYYPNENIKLLNKDINDESVRSTQGYFFSCPNSNHLPFEVSFDNMSRKFYGCPECQNRIVKNKKEKMKRCLSEISDIDLNIKKMILRYYGNLCKEDRN